METPVTPAELVPDIAILAKAPIAGLAKTRLSPALGAAGAAQLQARLTQHTVQTALAARLGPVTLWCTPDVEHPHFQAIAAEHGVACRPQVEGDLGARMQAVFQAACAPRPRILLGTDCPALQTADLHQAATLLTRGLDAVFQPAEDGGYVLVGLRRPCLPLFEDMPWSTAEVMALSRERARRHGLQWEELPMRWDVDLPQDLARLREQASLQHLLQDLP